MGGFKTKGEKSDVISHFHFLQKSNKTNNTWKFLHS